MAHAYPGVHVGCGFEGFVVLPVPLLLEQLVPVGTGAVIVTMFVIAGNGNGCGSPGRHVIQQGPETSAMQLGAGTG